jgi:hypothetical protein
MAALERWGALTAIHSRRLLRQLGTLMTAIRQCRQAARKPPFFPGTTFPAFGSGLPNPFQQWNLACAATAI